MKKDIDKQVNDMVELMVSENNKIPKKVAKYFVLDTIFEDLPDGAYFAAMAEHGYEPEDIIECNEKAQKLGLLNAKGGKSSK